ncbi:hypothetical protein FA15DRAFT_684259 [Coprinopsis marcescibilis]|uniref:Phorbol-ester/DAG-type domain-containing protein n=1 Tax=Coprinopsis marcescibilis TaxID=230819 RepID=A0A5C3LMM1_COPMA|nr:hypothetical protein FA15DRAFT_684259 [Coprinopsis marcescibilis]
MSFSPTSTTAGGTRAFPIKIDTDFATDFAVISSPRPSDGEISPVSKPGGLIPSLLVPSALSPSNESAESSLFTNPVQNIKRNPKAKNEVRKLFSHVLTQLANRRKPPPISETIKEVGRVATEKVLPAFSDAFKSVAKLGNAIQRSASSAGMDDEEEEDSDTFSTEATFELMLQLKDLLYMSIMQGWQIFEEDSVLQGAFARKDEPKSASMLGRSRHSFQLSGIRSRSSSPTRARQAQRTSQTPELFDQCLSALSSVISQDCRFQITNPRPSRPPNALQSLVLNVAQLLIHIHNREPRVVSRIGFAVIPAFSTFSSEMHGRLITFFEKVVIRGQLESLRLYQNLSKRDDPASLMSPTERRPHSPPIVSIQIEEVSNEIHHESEDSMIKVQSSNAPHQEATVYYLSSLVAPLMAAILEAVDITSNDDNCELPGHFNRLLDLIATLKIDSYNDLLAIVAYHTSRSRKQACAVLACLWPKVIGHSTISRSLAVPFRPVWNTTPSQFPGQRNHQHHQFVPWQFVQKASWPNDAIPQHTCAACSNALHNFGLLCPFCLCSVHFDCYDPPDGSVVLQYSMSGDPTTQKVAMYRFSYLLPSRDSGDPAISINNHNFTPINLFTLCPCYLCRQPLWGTVAQAIKCTRCSMISHSACVRTMMIPRCEGLELLSDHLTVDTKALRRSATQHFPELNWSFDQLALLSYEEVLVVYDTQRTQLDLLNNGVALGSILVKQKGIKPRIGGKLDEFEIHQTIYWCKQLLGSQSLHRSNATIDYMEENGIGYSEHSILYDFSNLVYLSTSMKSPISTQPTNPSASSDLLNVSAQEVFPFPQAESVAHPYEAVPLAHMQEILNVEFSIHTPIVIKTLFTHLHHLSFFERLEARPTSFVESMADKSDICVFPLPLGLDLSMDVETLVTAVEVCLLDLDLSVNEFAFLLLVRRFWPNGLMSDYGLKRLTRSIVSWIIAEDDNLATILRDHIAKQTPLPGVRSPSDAPPWPASRITRTLTDSQVSGNGRDYVVARRALLSRYAEPWLFSLHNQDPAAYEFIIYNACVELAEDRTAGIETFESRFGDVETKPPQHLNEVLYCVSKVAQSSIAFSALDNLKLRWLRMVNDFDQGKTPITGLNRVFLDSTSSRAAMSVTSPTQPLSQEPDGSSPSATGPLAILVQVASRSEADLNQVLNWVVMIVRSGLEIPLETLEQFLALVNSRPSNLTGVHLFVNIVMLSFWLKSMGRQNMQILFSRLLVVFEQPLVKALSGDDAAISELCLTTFRRLLAACSLIYGCDRTVILDMKFMTEEDTKELPSRRKLVTRASTVVDPIFIEPEILHTIGQFLQLEDAKVTSYIAKFFSLFFNHSPLVESYEVDNFILRNSNLVAYCAWHFYGVQLHGIDSIRSEFLLRVLAVDSESLQTLVDEALSPVLDWNNRLKAVNRLARIVTDVTSPAFNVDGRQWRSTVAELFTSFFSLLWKDPEEEIRLAVRTLCASLLPAQLSAITQCWNEALAKSPMKDRIKLVSFLLQMRPHFPGWNLVAWEILIETMSDFHYEPSSATEMQSMGNSSPDVGELLVSLLLLAMSLLSDGMEIDFFSLLKIKVQLVKILGFSQVQVIPMQNSSAFHIHFEEAMNIPAIASPCLEYLVPLIDAAHTIKMSFSIAPQETGTTNVLVGYVFIDVILKLVNTVDKLESLPVLNLKCMLEALYIILHKHDFEVYPAKPLQPLLLRTVGRVIELVSSNINYEVRQLALTVIQAFLKRCFAFIGSTVPAMLEIIAEMVASHGTAHQDSLITQGRAVILNILTSHSTTGLLATLFKHPMKPSFFVVMKQIFESQDAVVDPFAEPLPAIILRDTLLRASESEPNTIQNVVNNLHKFFELYSENFSQDLIIFTGQQMAFIMRRLSDSSAENVDSSPLVLILALLAQGNRKHTRDLLTYIDNSLRIALTRSSLNSECLIKLVKATQPKVKDLASANLGKVVTTMLEIMSDALRMKLRVHASTLNATIQCLMSNDSPILPDDDEARFKLLMANMVENASYFLDNQSWSAGHMDFNVSISVARVIMYTLEQDPITKRGAQQEVEVTYQLVNGVRSWIVLSIAALKETNRKWPAILFQHLPSFIHTYTSTMRPYAQCNLNAESATTDLNHAYIAIKIWLMVAKETSAELGLGDGPIIRVWNALWPVFENVLTALESDARAGLSSTLMVLASKSVTELFTFLRTLQTPIALDLVSRTEVINRLKAANGDTSQSRLRGARRMVETTQDATLESIVPQIARELIATEKLRMADGTKRVDFGGRPGSLAYVERYMG